MTLKERLDKTRELHLKGFNCAQCVAMAFTDVTDPKIGRETLASLTAGFGGGFGGCGETCGAISGMTAVAGLLRFQQPSDKRSVYDATSSLLNQFRKQNGAVMCRELRVPGGRSCVALKEDAVTILHNFLDEK